MTPRSLWKIRYFVDTEFTDFLDCQLISVAIVGEDGREFYGECSDFDRRQCSAFVREAALPQLGQGPSRSVRASTFSLSSVPQCGQASPVGLEYGRHQILRWV